MKRSHLAFTFSAALNVAVIATFVLRPSLAPAAFRDAFHLKDPSAIPATTKPKPAPRSVMSRKLWPLLASEDLPTLIARLRAAGFPSSVIREIVRAQVDARYEPRLREYTQPDPNTPYWKMPPVMFRGGTSRFEEYSQILRERAKLQRDLLADPFFASEDVSSAQRRQFGDLPRQKVDAVQRIEDDYAEMMSAIRTSTNGILLAEDREKLAFLAREKRADLASVLSATELADYELRSSPITRMVSRELGDFRATAAEFRAIFDVQQAMNEKFPFGGATMNSFTERRAAQQELDAQLRVKLGDARFNDYVRETSDDYQQLRRLVQRENLPPDTGMRTFEIRNTVSQESMRIFNDPVMSADQKRTALAALAQTARTQVLSLLGPVAGPTYVKTLDNQWLNIVASGAAVTFDGGPNRSIGSDNVLISFGSGPNFRQVGPVTPPPAR